MNVDVEQLNSVVSNIAQSTLTKQNKRVPEIYTAVVDSVNGYDSVTVHFASDTSTKMTVPNLSGIIPTVGKTVYIMTTGGKGITGSFVIACNGTTFLSDIYNTINQLKSQVEILEQKVSELENQ